MNEAVETTVHYIQRFEAVAASPLLNKISTQLLSFLFIITVLISHAF